MTSYLPFLWVLTVLGVVGGATWMSRRYGSVALTCLFAVLFVISNVLANKLVVFMSLTVPAGVIAFSITFLLSDMLSEFYGREAATRAVWMGLLAQIVLVPTVWIAIAWPAPDFWSGQAAFEATLGNTWRIVLAGILAYTLSQHHDVWAYHFWKRVTAGRHLWLRNNLSTIASQVIDTTVFATVAFAGVAPVGDIILGSLVAKITIALVDTPFLYLARWLHGGAVTGRRLGVAAGR